MSQAEAKSEIPMFMLWFWHQFLPYLGEITYNRAAAQSSYPSTSFPDMTTESSPWGKAVTSLRMVWKKKVNSYTGSTLCHSTQNKQRAERSDSDPSI